MGTAQASPQAHRTGPARNPNSLNEMARRLDISSAHASMVMRGLRMPSLALAASIADHQGITIDVLYKRLRSMRKRMGMAEPLRRAKPWSPSVN